jgi:hypothetical protein
VNKPSACAVHVSFLATLGPHIAQKRTSFPEDVYVSKRLPPINSRTPTSVILISDSSNLKYAACNIIAQSRVFRARAPPRISTNKRMETPAHHGVLELMERLLARARAAQQDTGPEVHRLVPGLQHRLRKTEELLRARGEKEAWLPEAKEAKLSPMEYMDRCNRFLCKLDTLGWKRSFHQNLFHAVCARARVLSCFTTFCYNLLYIILFKTPTRADARRGAPPGLHPRDRALLLQAREARHLRAHARTAAPEEQLGLHRPGDPHQHPAPLRQDHQ